VEVPILGGDVEKMLQRVDGKVKKQRRKRVPLPKAPPLSYGFSWHPIKKHPRGGGNK
jgi:hypothetical protein